MVVSVFNGEYDNCTEMSNIYAAFYKKTNSLGVQT